MSQQPNYTLRREAGFTLMEILVAVFVLSIGLLGMAGLQINGMNSTKSAQSRTLATFAAYDIIDRMRTNTDGVSGGDYDSVSCSSSGSLPSCISSGTGCSTADLASYDIYDWCTNYVDTLPDGSATVSKSGNVHTIAVNWTEASDADNPTKTVTVTVRF